MKPNSYLLLTLIYLFSFSLNLHSQERIPRVNTTELVIDGVNAYDNGEYEDALEYFEQINPNDTNGFIAFYEIALTLNGQEKYQETLDHIDSGKPSFWEQEPQMYNVYCMALEETDRMEEALDWYDKGQEQWPLNASILYNKAVALWADEQYEEAFKTFERTLELNPLHWNTHRQLGVICADEGYLAEALMCFNMCLISEYDYSYSYPIINFMEEIVSSNYSGEKKGINIYGEGGVSPHEELTLFIKNRVALDKKKYKFKHKFFKYNIIKQNHLLISNLNYDSDDTSIWGKYYTKHFSEVWDQGYFEDFGYSTFIGIASRGSKEDKVITKNKNSVINYLGWAKTNWWDNFSEIETPFKGEISTNKVYRYTNGVIYLVGHDSEEDADGYGETYYSTGVLSGKGNYSDGELDGEWIYFNQDGSLSGEFNYKDGEMDGVVVYYDEFGDRLGMRTFDDGEPQGLGRNYNSGVLSYEAIIEDGDLEGDFTTFFPDGSVEQTYTMNGSEPDGDYKSYYSNGEIETEFTREDKEVQGTIKTYFPGGKLYKEVEYEDDEENGPFVFYYYNGNKSSEGTYENGNYKGSYKTYFNDGTLASETIYDESGKENGLETNYVRQGWKLSEYEYKKGEITSYKFFNEAGDVVSENKRKGGKFYYESVDKDGTITAQGTYASGDEGPVGEWKYYDVNDYLESVVNFEDGEEEGLFTSYFFNGNTDVEVNYSEGERDGYYKEHYRTGDVFQQGWYDEGELEGLWERYYEDGTVSSNSYYVDDKRHGYAEDYSPEGVRMFARDYRFGDLVGLVIFDTTGVEETYLKIDTGLIVLEQYSTFGYLEAEKTYHNRSAYGDWRWYYPNKQIATKGSFIDGNRHGKWTWYFIDGQISQEGTYYLGKKTGEWNNYHNNGKLNETEFYEYDEVTGMNTTYFEDGTLATEIEYERGMRHGLAKYYSYDGKLQMMRKYEFDIIVSIAIDKLTTANPEWITLKDETGSVTTKYANGQIAREFSVEKGYFQGSYKEYYDNGQLHDSQTYTDGFRNGPFVAYYRDGTLKTEATFKHDEWDGIYKSYHPNGKLKKTLTYLNGEAHGWSEVYDTRGNLLKRIYYYAGSVEIIEVK